MLTIVVKEAVHLPVLPSESIETESTWIPFRLPALMCDSSPITHQHYSILHTTIVGADISIYTGTGEFTHSQAKESLSFLSV